MEKIKRALEALRNDLHHVPMTDRLASAFRHLDAALSELEGSKPKEPPRYVMSRDYDAAYERVCNGDHLFGEVDYNTRYGGAQMRDVVRVRRMKHGDIDIGVRGFGYGGVSNYDIKEHGSERAAFKWLCEAINLEWIAVEPPKEQGAEPVATALIHEHSKPSLMVGFSEEDVRLIADGVAEDCGVDDETEDGAYTWECMLECAMKVHEAHAANTRAVSIDKIMDEVMGWCCATKDAEEDLRERLMKMAALP